MDSKEFKDPIGRLTSDMKGERVSYHVLRGNSAGVTVYMQAQMEKKCSSDAWPYRKPYAIPSIGCRSDNAGRT